MAAFRDEHITLKRNDFGSVCFLARRLNGDNALRWARFTFANAKDFAFSIKRITVKHGCWHFNFVPAQIGNGLLAHVRDTHSRNNGKREARVHQRLAELTMLGIFLIEVQRMLVHRQQREPDIVVLGDRATGAMLVNIADLKVLKVPSVGFSVPVRSNFFSSATIILPPAFVVYLQPAPR